MQEGHVKPPDITYDQPQIARKGVVRVYVDVGHHCDAQVLIEITIWPIVFRRVRLTTVTPNRRQISRHPQLWTYERILGLARIDTPWASAR